MRGNYFSRVIPLLFILLILLPSIPLRATELFTVGRLTAEYFDGNAWTQLYDVQQFELNRLLDVWGSSDTNIYTVGTNGTIAHYDGTEWNDMVSGTSVRLESIWGSSGSDIFAVGAEGTILHFDGNSWSAMSSGTTYDLYDIWGISSTNIYVVGEEIVLHFNGNSWNRFITGYSGIFKAVWANSSGEVFISSVGRIIYYDGNNWRELQNNPVTSGINDIWGSTADDIFFACEAGIILHYDGKQFTSTYAGSGSLEGIYGNSNDDIYVASYIGRVYHFNGSDWTEIDISSLIYLRDIFPVSTNNIITVGSKILSNPRAVIYQFDGVDWSTMLPDAFPELEHVWAGSSNNVFVVGSRDEVDNIVCHYDGIEWTETAPIPPLDPIRDIWGTSSDNVFAIIRHDDTILHYDGNNWSVMADYSAVSLMDIWGNSGSDIYIVSRSGKIYHYDGNNWSERAVSPYSGMSSIYGSPNGEIFVVGYYWPWGEICHGYASHYDGLEWTTMELYQGAINGQEYTTIWGYSEDDIFFTIGNLVYHYDGVELSSIGPPIDLWAAYDCWGDSDGNLYFVNGFDEIHHYDGSDWSTIYTGNGEYLLDIWGWEDYATSVSEIPAAHLTLTQNYPNPFNPSTAIEYYLIEDEHVTLDIYSVSGRLICTLLDDFQTQGKHSIRWGGLDDTGRQVASGIYFCRIKTASGMQTKKIVLAR